MNSSDDFLRLLGGALSELHGADPADADGEGEWLRNTPVDERFAAATEALGEASRRMRNNYPYASPLYAGQMLKPPHVVARSAYAMAMGVNPNNHALDGGRESSAMEVEAVAELAAMFGFKTEMRSFLGHLTSGGTFANLEALWIAGQTTGKKMVVASTQAHYTHARISAVLGLPFRAIGTDAAGRMSLEELEGALQSGQVGTVVATLGTTALGAVDPLDGIVKLRARYGFRLHVDAAYGGYFKLATNLAEEATAAFAAVQAADSLVVDPHKHGLQPYGCGCVLFADATVARLYRHDSPYTYFSSAELHLGEITLECSRAGAAAVALWTTQRLLPLVAGGTFAEGMERCHEAAVKFYELLRGAGCFVVPPGAPQLDIVVWACAGGNAEESSARARVLFGETAKLGLHLALAEVPTGMFAGGTWGAAKSVTCLRSVLMKWEHLDWIDRIFGLLMEAAGTSAAI